MQASLLEARTRSGLSRNPPAPPNDQRLRLRAALRAQRAEIIRHRDALAELLERPVTLDEAARDWIGRHAATWRTCHEPVHKSRAGE